MRSHSAINSKIERFQRHRSALIPTIIGLIIMIGALALAAQSKYSNVVVPLNCGLALENLPAEKLAFHQTFLLGNKRFPQMNDVIVKMVLLGLVNGEYSIEDMLQPATNAELIDAAATMNRVHEAMGVPYRYVAEGEELPAGIRPVPINRLLMLRHGFTINALHQLAVLIHYSSSGESLFANSPRIRNHLGGRSVPKGDEFSFHKTYDYERLEDMRKDPEILALKDFFYSSKSENFRSLFANYFSSASQALGSDEMRAAGRDYRHRVAQYGPGPESGARAVRDEFNRLLALVFDHRAFATRLNPQDPSHLTTYLVF